MTSQKHTMVSPNFPRPLGEVILHSSALEGRPFKRGPCHWPKYILNQQPGTIPQPSAQVKGTHPTWPSRHLSESKHCSSACEACTACPSGSQCLHPDGSAEGQGCSTDLRLQKVPRPSSWGPDLPAKGVPSWWTSCTRWLTCSILYKPGYSAKAQG